MNKRVLVVDDEQYARSTIRLLLSKRGYQADEAKDGVEALSKLRGHDYDLIITDVMMPNMNGYEMVQRLSPQQLERTPVVMLTLMAGDEHIRKGYSVGGTYYMTKPVHMQRLLDAAEYLTEDLGVARRDVLEARL